MSVVSWVLLAYVLIFFVLTGLIGIFSKIFVPDGSQRFPYSNEVAPIEESNACNQSQFSHSAQKVIFSEIDYSITLDFVKYDKIRDTQRYNQPTDIMDLRDFVIYELLRQKRVTNTDLLEIKKTFMVLDKAASGLIRRKDIKKAQHAPHENSRKDFDNNLTEKTNEQSQRLLPSTSEYSRSELREKKIKEQSMSSRSKVSVEYGTALRADEEPTTAAGKVLKWMKG